MEEKRGERYRGTDEWTDGQIEGRVDGRIARETERGMGRGMDGDDERMDGGRRKDGSLVMFLQHTYITTLVALYIICV